MSRLLNLKGVAVLLAAILLVAAPKQKVLAQPNVNVTFQTFYNDLQPYGQWVDNAQYGYCWVPNVARGFRPYYTNGYWAMTEYGNTWVSNYSWGWAPFHYGNWTYDDFYGWMWVPGTTWGPAWVTWRNGGGHYGWAPIAPGISITVATSPRYYCNNDWWIFVPQRNIYSRTLNYHWRGARYNSTYIRQTTIINNTYINNNHRYVTGPRRAQIQRATGMNVRTYGVRSGMKPGRSQVRGNNVNIYRPTVRKGTNTRPQRVVQAGQGQRRTAAPAAQQRTAPANQRRASTQRMPQRSAPATQQRSNTAQRKPQAVQRSAATRAPQRTAPAQQRNTNVQRQPQAAQRNANVQRAPQRQNMAQNTQASRQAAARQQQQQQKRITERRQQSWQNRAQATPQQNISRSSSSSRSSTSRAPVNRNTQRARPQSQSRPQPSRATQRSSAPQRSNASRSSGSSRSGNSRRR